MTSVKQRSGSIVKGWATSVKHGLSRLRLWVTRKHADVVQVFGLALVWCAVLALTDWRWAMLGFGMTLFFGSVAYEMVKVWGSDG